MPKNFSIFFGFKSFKYYFTLIPCVIFDDQPLLIKGITIEIKSSVENCLTTWQILYNNKLVDSNESIMKGSVAKL